MTKPNNLILMLILSISIFSQAQTRKDARLLYDNLFPISLVSSYHSENFVNQRNQSINYSFPSANAFSIGLDYNFAQSGRFNFKVGFFVKRFKPKSTLRIDGSDLGMSNDFVLERSKPAIWTLNLPVTIEYVRRINSNIYLSAFAGYGFQYVNTSQNNRVADLSINNEPRVRFVDFNNSTTIYGGLSLGLGSYFKIGNDSFLKLDISFISGNTTILGETALVSNLDQSANASSDHAWTGDNTTISLRFTPPKRWFSTK